MTAKADKFLVSADLEELQKRLSRIPEAKGMYVRQTGTKLILGRKVRTGTREEVEDDDRLKLTALDRDTYGLSARTWNARWEHTGFEGTIADLVGVIRGALGHYLTDDTGPTADPEGPPRTSAPRH